MEKPPWRRVKNRLKNIEQTYKQTKTNKNKHKTNLPSEPQVQKPRCIRVKKIK
jgi:hypothetical protein